MPLPNSKGRETPGAATMERDSGHIPPRPESSAGVPANTQNQTGQTARGKLKAEPDKASGKSMNDILVKLKPLLEQVKAKLLKPQPGVSQSKQMAMLVMVPILLIVVFIVFGRLLFKPSPKGTGTQQTVQSAGAAVSLKTEIEWTLPQPYPDNLRDPMQKVSVSTGSVGTISTVENEFLIRGIVYSTDNPSAVIDAQIVYQGDTYEGAKIIKINRNSIEFERDGKTWEQKIGR